MANNQTNEQDGQDIGSLLSDGSNIAGLATLAAAEAAFIFSTSQYFIGQYEGDLIKLPFAVSIGLAGFGVGKCAYKAVEAATKVKRALIGTGIAAGLVALSIPLFFAVQNNAAPADEAANYVKKQDASVRSKLDECDYSVYGNKIELRNSGTMGIIGGNPGLLGTGTSARLYIDGENGMPFLSFDGTLGKLILQCEDLQEQQAMGIMPKYTPGYNPAEGR